MASKGAGYLCLFLFSVFIAMDSEKYDRLSNDIGYIYKTIKQEGKVIYG